MPINKLALLRYRTIDNCLQNRFRKWTLDDIIEKISDTLYEYEGIDTGVSKRTVQLDIQNMRSDKLGFEAPIIVVERKYYTYAEKDYSITNTPISNYDIEKLGEVVGILKQFKGFNYFKDLSSMVAKLEDKILKQKNKGVSYIELDKNKQLKGLEYIESIHAAILNKNNLLVKYKPFKAQNTSEQIIFPYLLKEYNNRWFLLAGFHKGSNISLLALDRILEIKEESTVKYIPPPVDIFRYFEDVIGVSKTAKQRARKIMLRIQKEQMPYLLTKPLHPSQQILKEEDNWITFRITVIWNYELEREILGLGEVIEVLSPKRLREKIKRRLSAASNLYK